MSHRSLTPFFDDLPEWVKRNMEEASLTRKDWKRCSHCRVHDGDQKLSACTQCKPFTIIPEYYCSRKCQRAEWPKHKAQCIEHVRHGTPISQEQSENNQFPLKKRVEHWRYIHSENIQRLIALVYYFQTASQPHSSTALVDLHIDDAESDPPRIWPAAIELAPKVEHHDIPWSKRDSEFIDYIIMFPGGSIYRSYSVPRSWRTDLETSRYMFPDYDLIFLNLFLAAPQTRKEAEMHWDFMRAALKVGRALRPCPFIKFDAEKSLHTERNKGSAVVEFDQSDEWLAIHRQCRIWKYVDQLGHLREVVEKWEKA